MFDWSRLIRIKVNAYLSMWILRMSVRILMYIEWLRANIKSNLIQYLWNCAQFPDLERSSSMSQEIRHTFWLRNLDAHNWNFLIWTQPNCPFTNYQWKIPLLGQVAFLHDSPLSSSHPFIIYPLPKFTPMNFFLYKRLDNFHQCIFAYKNFANQWLILMHAVAWRSLN